MTAPRTIYYEKFVLAGPDGSTDIVDPRRQPPGSGGGGGGEPPDPVTGVRPFIASSLPLGGFGPWGGTIEPVTPSNVSQVYTQSQATGQRILILPAGATGPNSPVIIGGQFNAAEYIRRVRLLYGHPAMQQGLADGTFFGFYIIDEPHLASRWGRVIPRTELIDMVAAVNEGWPGQRTYIRADPDADWVQNGVPGLRGLWVVYKTNRDPDPARFRDQKIALAQAKGHALVMSANVIHFHGPSTNDTPSNWCTPAQMDSHVDVLARNSYCDLFSMWQYEQAWYSQAGMVDKIRGVRSTFASFDS